MVFENVIRDAVWARKLWVGMCIVVFGIWICLFLCREFLDYAGVGENGTIGGVEVFYIDDFSGSEYALVYKGLVLRRCQ